jgi:[ribosomal protein S5]-alanine N-acetyltransferase
MRGLTERSGDGQGAWPVELREGRIGVRPLRARDARVWRTVRSQNVAWLAPWEATHPDVGDTSPSFGQMVRIFRREARVGRMLPFVITYDDQLVGQLTVSGINWGSLRSAQAGYWVDRRYAGRGIVPTALALVVDHCFQVVGLHRIEINIRPENAASLRVAHKLGFRPEGLRRRLLHIDGAWRDHATFALTVEDVPLGLLNRWRAIVEDEAHARADQARRIGSERAGVTPVPPVES